MMLLVHDKIRMVLLVTLLVSVPAFQALALDEDEIVPDDQFTDIQEPLPLQFDDEVERKPDKRRNPFALTDRLIRAANNGDFSLMQKNSDEIPPMYLRGLIKGDDGDIVALLEIEKAIHIVRAGDTVGLNDLGINTVIRIKKINRLNVIVETGTMGQLIIVR